MKDTAEKLKVAGSVFFYAVITMPIYAYLTFYFVYPVIGVIPIGFYPYTGFLYILYSVLIGVGIGMLMESAQHGFLTVIISSIMGYILSIVYLGFPAYLYGYSIYLSDIYIFSYIQYSFLLLILYLIFGLIGLMFGGYLRDKLE